MSNRVPDKITEQIELFVNNENTLGFNQSVETEDGMASYQLKNWSVTDNTVTVGLWISQVSIVEPHANQFTSVLESHGFSCTEQFHEIEDEYADFQDKTAYEATFESPVTR